jgi:hypothetical protein
MLTTFFVECLLSVRVEAELLLTSMCTLSQVFQRRGSAGYSCERDTYFQRHVCLSLVACSASIPVCTCVVQCFIRDLMEGEAGLGFWRELDTQIGSVFEHGFVAPGTGQLAFTGWESSVGGWGAGWSGLEGRGSVAARAQAVGDLALK